MVDLECKTLLVKKGGKDFLGTPPPPQIFRQNFALGAFRPDNLWALSDSCKWRLGSQSKSWEPVDRLQESVGPSGHKTLKSLEKSGPGPGTPRRVWEKVLKSRESGK